MRRVGGGENNVAMHEFHPQRVGPNIVAGGTVATPLATAALGGSVDLPPLVEVSQARLGGRRARCSAWPQILAARWRPQLHPLGPPVYLKSFGDHFWILERHGPPLDVVQVPPSCRGASLVVKDGRGVRVVIQRVRGPLCPPLFQCPFTELPLAVGLVAIDRSVLGLAVVHVHAINVAATRNAEPHLCGVDGLGTRRLHLTGPRFGAAGRFEIRPRHRRHGVQRRTRPRLAPPPSGRCG
mmetsp:Transcript_36850/g.96533  ORF Transcript_36850/g.96533 Transcript_36850/m.96533 type:complete len:239 (+) Transcript_36850:1984-2700(+)